MSYGNNNGRSAIGGAEQMQKDYNAACNVKMNPGGSQACPSSQDPASLREQAKALMALCERLNAQRSRLRDIADTVLGTAPEHGQQASTPGTIPPVGGVVADIVSAFELAGTLLTQVDHEINRLSRVAS